MDVQFGFSDSQLFMKIYEVSDESRSAAAEFVDAFVQHQPPAMEFGMVRALICPIHGPLTSKVRANRPDELSVVLTIDPCCSQLQQDIASYLATVCEELRESLPELMDDLDGDAPPGKPFLT